MVRLRTTNPATRAVRVPWMDRTIRFTDDGRSRHEVAKADADRLLESDRVTGIELVDDADDDADDDDAEDDAEDDDAETDADDE